MVRNWGGYTLFGAFHQAISLAPLILMTASDNISCVLVLFRAQDLLQTQALNEEACLAVLQGIHQEIR